MNKITQKIKSFLRVMLITLFCGVIGVPSVLAAGPAFNNLDGDREFLQGVNETAGQSSYSDPVTAEAGDTVRVAAYYHNTVPGTTATNTRVKINIPSNQAASFKLTGTLGADNAPTVDGTYINGIEVGSNGMTINTSLGTNQVEFISGSTTWYPNGSSSPVNLPFSQSGDEIVSAGGLNIGDINGCWQYAGYVVFKVRVKGETGQPNIVKSKTAFNETQNANAPSVKAKPSDIIRYTLTTSNTGTVEGEQVINDDLTDILEYADITDLGGGVMSGSTIVYDEMGFIDPGQTVTDIFKIKIKDPLPMNGDFRIDNIYGNQISIEIIPPEIGGEPLVKIEKQIRNITLKSGYASGALVNPGNTVEYRITIQNHHGKNEVKNLRVKDILDAGLIYIKGSGKIQIAGQTGNLPDGVFSSNGYLFLDPTLGPKGQHDTMVITFRALVSKNLADSKIVYNKACASGKFFTNICDSAKALVQVPETPKPQPKPPTSTPPVIPKTGPVESLALITGLTSGMVLGIRSLRNRKLRRK